MNDPGWFLRMEHKRLQAPQRAAIERMRQLIGMLEDGRYWETDPAEDAEYPYACAEAARLQVLLIGARNEGEFAELVVRFNTLMQQEIEDMIVRGED